MPDNINVPPDHSVQVATLVANAGAASLNVFPNAGDAINGAAVNTALATPVNKTTAFSSAVAGQWHAVLSA